MIIPYLAGMLTVIVLIGVKEHFTPSNNKLTILSNKKIIEYNQIHVYAGKHYLRKRFFKLKDNNTTNTNLFEPDKIFGLNGIDKCNYEDLELYTNSTKCF